MLAVVFWGTSKHICQEFMDDPNYILQHIYGADACTYNFEEEMTCDTDSGGKVNGKWLTQKVKASQDWCRRIITD